VRPDEAGVPKRTPPEFHRRKRSIPAIPESFPFARIGVRPSYNLHFSEKWGLFFRQNEGTGIFSVEKEVNLSLFQEKFGNIFL